MAGETKAQGWEGIKDSLQNAVGDLATLSVETYTGELSVAVNSDNKSLKWSDLLSLTQSEDATIKGKLKLVLATQVNIDGDAKNFIASSGVTEALIEAHSAAVRNGSEFRAKIIGLAVGKLTS
ncbi:hypothetical protein DXV75_09810 [Alteromonas aestuariivivens]|uniref:Uncharacterized protein n=1 Tax=Alteromonas aestuariivivens TaxID=1938339 RepID=A0A3D8M775_9ALTE|nr:hypothetical protein [Alteromonas aestuariivivens]RDV25575.1 hypothetical protein DXV75_09810 [Alteromonas aestuariivivens]